jgi:hypothetical protein
LHGQRSFDALTGCMSFAPVMLTLCIGLHHIRVSHVSVLVKQNRYGFDLRVRGGYPRSETDRFYSRT